MELDQGAINQIIVDAEGHGDGGAGKKVDNLEKEFMILKGAIKKLIIDIREQMNSTDNPFSNIQMLQMMPPAPVIKEDPVELEAPKDKNAEAEAQKKAEAEKKAVAEKIAEEAKGEARKLQAELEKLLAMQAGKAKPGTQEKSAGNGCPFATGGDTAHDRCPLAANRTAIDPRCPAARGSPVQNTCPASRYPCEAPCCGYREQYPYYDQHCGREADSRRAGCHLYSDVRSPCASCGLPAGPAYDAYSPMPYPGYPPMGWQDRSDYGAHQRISRQAAFARRQPHSEYPGPARQGHPAYPEPESGYDRDPRYASRDYGRRRVKPLPPAYAYDDADDRYYSDQVYYERSRHADEGCEPEYSDYPAGPKGWRARRAAAALPAVLPAVPRDDYYEQGAYRGQGQVPDVAGPRRRRATTPHQPPEYQSDETFEMTEPRPDIDGLPDQTETEPRVGRKRARIARITVEPEEPVLIEQPNPRPRRSRSSVHGR